MRSESGCSFSKPRSPQGTGSRVQAETRSSSGVKVTVRSPCDRSRAAVSICCLRSAPLALPLGKVASHLHPSLHSVPHLLDNPNTVAVRRAPMTRPVLWLFVLVPRVVRPHVNVDDHLDDDLRMEESPQLRIIIAPLEG